MRFNIRRRFPPHAAFDTVGERAILQVRSRLKSGRQKVDWTVVCCPGYKRGDSEFALRGKSADFRDHGGGTLADADVLPPSGGEIPQRIGTGGMIRGADFGSVIPTERFHTLDAL